MPLSPDQEIFLNLLYPGARFTAGLGPFFPPLTQEQKGKGQERKAQRARDKQADSMASSRLQAIMSDPAAANAYNMIQTVGKENPDWDQEDWDRFFNKYPAVIAPLQPYYQK